MKSPPAILLVLFLAAVSVDSKAAINWNSIPGCPAPFSHHSAFVYGNAIYAIGETFQPEAATWRYDPVSSTWTAKAPPPLPIKAPAVAVVGDKLYVVGAIVAFPYSSAGALENVLVYDLLADSWSTGPAIPANTLFDFAAAVGGVIYTGGSFAFSGLNAKPDLYAFNPATGIWSARAPMPTARTRLAFVPVGGKIYAIGGCSRSTPPGPPGSGTLYDTVEVYDPAANTWATGASMPTARMGIDGAVAGGRIYVADGWNGSELNTVESYSFSSNAWRSETSLPCVDVYAPLVASAGTLYLLTSYSIAPCSGSEFAGTVLVAGPLDVAVVSPSVVSVGQWFTVTVTGSNGGTGPVEDAGAMLTMEPSGLVLSKGGPMPSGLQVIQAGGATSFMWTLSASGAGTVEFTGSVTGWDPNESVYLTGTGTGSVLVQMPARLSGTLTVPAQACVGTVITLMANVTNMGEASARNVTPSATLVVTGTGAAVRLSSSPMKTTLTGGASWTFTWDYRPTMSGTVWFEGAVTGKDGNAWWPIGTGPLVSGTLLIVAPAVLDAAASGPAPPPVSVGQWLTVALTVTNTGGVPADLVSPVIGVSPAGASVVLKDWPSAGLTLDPGSATTFAWTYSVSGWGRVTFTMSAPGLDTCHALDVGRSVIVDLGNPAALAVSGITVSPDPVCEGTIVSVSLTVTNTGQVPATGVTGLPVVIAGSAVLASAPVPIGNLPGGGSSTLTWTYSATAQGGLAFAVTLTGTDARSGLPVSAPPVGSNTVTVTPRAFLSAAASASLSGTILSGGWVDVMLTVTNTGANGATAVYPRWTKTGGTATAVLVGGPVPAGPVSLAAGAMTTFVWTLSVAGSGTANLLLSATGFSCAVPVSGSAPITVLVRRPAVLAIDSLTLSPGSMAAGSTVYATLLVRNAGDIGMTVTVVGRSPFGGILWDSAAILSLPVGLAPGGTATWTWSHLSRTFCGNGGVGASVSGWEEVSGRWLSASRTSGLVTVWGRPASLALVPDAPRANTGTGVGLVATVRDACGNGVPNTSVSYTVLDGGGWLSSMNAMTDGAGQARVTLTLGPIPGTNRARAQTASPALSAEAAVEGVNPLGLATAGAGLSTNAINPWKGEVVIARIRPLAPGPIMVRIFTASGKLVRTLRNQRDTGDGQSQAIWDGKTEDEFPVARGVYIIKVDGGGLNETLKIVVR